MILLTMIPHRWVDPEFKKEKKEEEKEDTSREVEAGREVQPLKAKK